MDNYTGQAVQGFGPQGFEPSGGPQVQSAEEKLAQMLQIPVEELWEKVPGVTQQDVDRWKAARAQGDSLTALGALLDRQMGETVNI